MEKEKGYLKGIIGALIGGLIGSIPWLLMYVYGNYITSLLAAVIALGALKGYQILKGKEDKIMIIIVAISSMVDVVIANLILAPLLILAENNLAVSLSNLKIWYQTPALVEPLMQDFVSTVLFAILGVGLVVSNINRQVKRGNKITGLSTVELDKKSVENYKDALTKLNALDKESAVSKDMLLELVDSEYHNDLNILINQNIIGKYKKNYYLK